MDVRIQNLFREVQKGNFDPNPLDFIKTFEEIVFNCTFKACLSSCIHNSKTKREREKGKDKEKIRGCEEKRRNTRGRFVRNSTVHPGWWIRPDENYSWSNYHPISVKHTQNKYHRSWSQERSNTSTYKTWSAACNGSRMLPHIPSIFWTDYARYIELPRKQSG